MCHGTCILFGCTNLKDKEINAKKVLEIGSLDINGSLRCYIESFNPEEYVGIDIVNGRGVDCICTVENLIDEFGTEKFDLVVATEVIEHIKDWKIAISNMKNICKSDGIILITTRSVGFPIHGYPHDYWRFEFNDMEEIFSDCEIVAIENDHSVPGVFAKIKKPSNFQENDLSDYELYSVITNKKTKFYPENEFITSIKFKIKHYFYSTSKKVFDYLYEF